MAKHKNNDYKGKQQQKQAGSSNQGNENRGGQPSSSSRSNDASDRSGYNQTKKNNCGY